MKINLFFNILVFIVCYGLFEFVIKKYFIKARYMEFRFRIFALRDRLCHLVDEGKLSEDSETYNFLVHNFNSYVKYLEKMDFLFFFKKHIQLQLKPEYSKQLANTINDCRKTNKEVAELMRDFEITVMDIIIKNSHLIRYVGLALTIVNVIKSINKSQLINNILIKRIEIADGVMESQKQRIELLGSVV